MCVVRGGRVGRVERVEQTAVLSFLSGRFRRRIVMTWSEDVTALVTCFGMEALTTLWCGSAAVEAGYEEDTDEDENERGDLEREKDEEEGQKIDSEAEALDISAPRARGDRRRALGGRVYGAARAGCAACVDRAGAGCLVFLAGRFRR